MLVISALATGSVRHLMLARIFLFESALCAISVLVEPMYLGSDPERTSLADHPMLLAVKHWKVIMISAIGTLFGL